MNKKFIIILVAVSCFLLLVFGAALVITPQKTTLSNEPEELVKEQVVPLSKEEVANQINLDYTLKDFCDLAAPLNPTSVILNINGTCSLEIEYITGTTSKNILHIEKDTLAEIYTVLYKFINKEI